MIRIGARQSGVINPSAFENLNVDLLNVEVFVYLFLKCIPKSTRFKPLRITLDADIRKLKSRICKFSEVLRVDSVHDMRDDDDPAE